MNLFHRLSRLAAFAATTTTGLAPRPALAQEPATARMSAATAQPTGPTPARVQAAFQVSDVALDAQGSLAGQALTPHGLPLANAHVVLDDGVSTIATRTDAQGRFVITGLRGGAYQLDVAGNTKFLRTWSAVAAPPNASQGVMVIDGSPAVLAQYCGSPVTCGSPVRGGMVGLGGTRETLRNPLVVGGIVAAAIAVPVALANTDDDPAS